MKDKTLHQRISGALAPREPAAPFSTGEAAQAQAPARFYEDQAQATAQPYPHPQRPPEPEPPKALDKGGLFPVKLLKGYCPRNPYIVHRDGQKVEVTPPTGGKSSVYDKVAKDSVIEVPKEEAREIIAKKIGERADGLTL